MIMMTTPTPKMAKYGNSLMNTLKDGAPYGLLSRLWSGVLALVSCGHMATEWLREKSLYRTYLNDL